MNRIHLFCFPYAGGSAMMYCRWRSLLPASIQIHPIELSGRGKRMNEPFYQTMEQAVEDAYLSIPVHVLDEPIAFFGYSMGSLIAYELTRYLHEKHGKEPIHLFAAARRAPQIQGDGQKLYCLPEAEFLQEIIKLGGMSAEVLENKELMEMILPLLRADMQIVEKYSWRASKAALRTDITVLAGTRDVVPDEHMEAWKEMTAGRCTIAKYEGDHFFIHQHYELIGEHITRVLLQWKEAVTSV
ncbi:thioesterase II family protein [Paenibacillus dendritiformis]|uniref:thioesterase II family protein n=2 Tax=Paenibacillus dendritiformis TaxID=130049 RepID=UPI00143D6F4B|nr:thioesterase [Paenibacillus dendritiformis]NKI24894.1 thioesterase [Paenibacillus dendritiformis]NRG00054.1 thioesterase [Paenibacillus dendritiformis]